LQHETDEMAKISLDAVNAVAKKYARQSGATLLLVGDMTKIQAAVKELNLGDLVILDVEGRPAAKN